VSVRAATDTIRPPDQLCAVLRREPWEAPFRADFDIEFNAVKVSLDETQANLACVSAWNCTANNNLGFVPNSILIMQRKPKMTKAFAAMTASTWDPEGKVDRGLKRLIAHVASRAAGCQYCMAHTAGGALHFGVEEQKLAAI
jgi:AhpD family alkylhydroperoxidase